MAFIYGIFNADNKCLYVGQTKRENPEKTRWKEHQRDIRHKKHKIKKLNTYEIDDLEFRVLLELKTDNTLLLSLAECCYNSIYKPLNKCVLQGFKGSVVTLTRCEKDVAEQLLEIISNA